MKKKFGAFGAKQFSLETLVGGRPGTTIFQNPGGGGGGRIQGLGPAAPPGAGHLFIHTDGCCSEFLNWGFVNLFDNLVQWRWFHCISWCVFIKGHSYNLCDAAARAMDRALQNVDYYYGLTDMSSLTIQHVVRNKQHFVRKLRILKRTDFWNVYKWLAGAYRSSGSHTDHQQKPVLIRDEKVKWLDFGSTPDPVHLQPHPGYVWLK